MTYQQDDHITTLVANGQPISYADRVEAYLAIMQEVETDVFRWSSTDCTITYERSYLDHSGPGLMNLCLRFRGSDRHHAVRSVKKILTEFEEEPTLEECLE